MYIRGVWNKCVILVPHLYIGSLQNRCQPRQPVKRWPGQGLLILVCVAIYAVLIQGIATGGDPIGAIWGCMGYSVLLCFCLFKTGSIARSVFSAH